LPHSSARSFLKSYPILISASLGFAAMAYMVTKPSAPLPKSPPPLVEASERETEIEQSFKDFRESAVRLVERVTDILGQPPDPVAAGQKDLHLLRSVFGKWSA